MTGASPGPPQTSPQIDRALIDQPTFVAGGGPGTSRRGTTKPIWRSGTFYVGGGGVAALMQMQGELRVLPQPLIWPHVAVMGMVTLVVVAMIVQRALADLGKYRS